MRKLHLTPINNLPAITPEDHEFAVKISNDFGLPLDEISWLVRYARNEIQDDFSDYMNTSRLKDTYQELFGPGAEIISVCIKTNKSEIDIEKSSPVFDQYFREPIRRLKHDFRDTLGSEMDFLFSLTRRSLFAQIITFFEGTSLNKMQQNIAIFDFLLHFNFGGPVKTEDEWNKNQTADQDYPHYKNGIIKNRKKLYISDPNLPYYGRKRRS